MKRDINVSDGLFQTNFDIELESADRVIKEIPIELLEDDPNNEEIYGVCDTDSLTESIKEYGIREPIRAYKIPKSSKYLIQSGHRRKYNAIADGLKTVPVIELDWIEDENERKRLLIDANIHNRLRSPLVIAKEVKIYMDTFQGSEVRKTELFNQIAEHFQMSTMTLRRYLYVLELIQPLQEKADSRLCAMSGIVEAHNMTIKEQEQFNQAIDDYIKNTNAQEVPKNVLMMLAKQIKQSKQIPTLERKKPERNLQTASDNFLKICKSYQESDEYIRVLIQTRDKINALLEEFDHNAI